MENSITKREIVPLKIQESNLLSINLAEDSHTNIISPITTKITGSNNHYSLIPLNINGLNSPIKRHKLTDWLPRQVLTFCCIQEQSDKDSYYLRVKGWKIILQANGPKKQAGVAILILNKINFQPQVIKKDKEGHITLVKGKTSQDELTILNMYAPKSYAPTFIKETLQSSKHTLCLTQQ
jgi:exonuclease III